MTGANIDRCQESQKIIVINEFSTFKLFTMQNFEENGLPHSQFPVPLFKDSLIEEITCILNSSLNYSAINYVVFKAIRIMAILE